MKFTISTSIEILERTPVVLRSLLQGLSDEWVTPNEGSGTWSAYDIVGHLIHGEKTDWIPRMQIIRSGSDERKFEKFDRFAQFENSKGKTMLQLLNEFSQLREINMNILRSANITDSHLGETGVHPAFGNVTLSQLLSTWVVHDLNHIAQISRVMAKQYKEAVGPWIAYLGILNQ